jgi:citrate lyase beta subunit
LTLLAPDIVEAILDGRQPDGITLPKMMKPFPVEWKEQREEAALRRPGSFAFVDA